MRKRKHHCWIEKVRDVARLDRKIGRHVHWSGVAQFSSSWLGDHLVCTASDRTELSLLNVRHGD